MEISLLVSTTGVRQLMNWLRCTSKAAAVHPIPYYPINGFFSKAIKYVPLKKLCVLCRIKGIQPYNTPTHVVT